MNHELITKLAKLANNNPNENEANAAARKVCKLLAEANFDFGKTTTSQQSNTNRGPEGHYGSPMSEQEFYDILRNMAGSRRYSQGYSYGADYDGPFRPSGREKSAERGKSDAERRAEEEKKEQQYKADEENRRRQRDANMKKEADRVKRESSKTLRQCVKCGITKLTAYLGNDYICSECQWRV